MSLVIRNLQRVIPIRRAPLRSKIEIVRRILGVQKFDLGIICVDNKNIQHINRIYRDRNVPTDVLSFPFHEVTATHGLCHLLGFTHSTEAEWQQELDVRPALVKMTQMFAFNTGLPKYFQLNVFTKESGLSAEAESHS
ncbi:YBEY isoform 9 [Pongo abelii]|uniref:YBEY isoform 9 n=1 Tax=Pongo abelii TaxID=9601 RepID=A0A2J8RBY4_PONAB|nr:YBEY isoform 9 [Pongo abelii]